jgi:pantetheine-phosphate adenylyltransferase
MKIAVFPGSFDPVTLGHMDIIQKGLALFDQIIVGIGDNTSKKYMFSLQEREKWLTDSLNKFKNVKVTPYSGLTVNFCKSVGAKFILRGIRNAPDFEFEKAIAHMNNALEPEIETVFVLSDLRYSAISSSIVRDIIRNGGEASGFIPPSVKY